MDFCANFFIAGPQSLFNLNSAGYLEKSVILDPLSNTFPSCPENSGPVPINKIQRKILLYAKYWPIIWLWKGHVTNFRIPDWSTLQRRKKFYAGICNGIGSWLHQMRSNKNLFFCRSTRQSLFLRRANWDITRITFSGKKNYSLQFLEQIFDCCEPFLVGRILENHIDQKHFPHWPKLRNADWLNFDFKQINQKHFPHPLSAQNLSIPSLVWPTKLLSFWSWCRLTEG